MLGVGSYVGMRIRRTLLLDSGRGQYFHVVSRVVDRRFIFGDPEKEIFFRMLRRHEGFSGVQVLSYCLMSNHFHLLVYVPVRPEDIPEKEVFKRMKYLYKSDQIAEFRAYLKDLDGETGERMREEFLDRFRNRMYHLSHFMRELKLRFSKYYNIRNDRKGTLWEERFKCSLIEGCSNALMNTAAYIELNPVRAGIVDDPAKYRWCSFTEAISGNQKARMGIIALASGMNLPLPYRDAISRYREYYIYKSRGQSEKKPGMSEVCCQESASSISETITRIRYFTDGVLLGSREFIEDWYHRNKDKLHLGRKTISSQVKSGNMQGIHTYRKV